MNLEDRIKRRLLIEGVSLDEKWHRYYVGKAFDADFDSDYYYLPPKVVIRIAAHEAEDTANPIAATAIVRRPFELTIDEEAFRKAIS